MVEYLKSSTAQYQVFFPDHCCGPDILFKDRNTLYIIQVKFVDTVAKQGTKILPLLTNLHLERQVFLHTTTETTVGMEEVTVINQDKHPRFFDNLDSGMWAVLNSIRDEFNQK
ncbi:hypothetical protein BJ741DRAFT_639792 [Chytriomyces cf. hyalinus JEL632]|nr:hypothetical protein BJ741DRAFT_639792 [Chytriomyces cf. hyalinus JEL632]